MRWLPSLPIAATSLSALLVACSSADSASTSTSASSTSGSSTSGGSGGGGGGGTGGDGGGAACMPTAVPCSDEVILEMNLKKDPAPGLIQNQADGSGWSSIVDATAGGAFSSNPHAYVYAKFGDAGLEKVAIGDEASLESTDWDIAFRRYVVRINSGNSGPSCVTAAHVPGAPDYPGLAAVPDKLKYNADAYFTDSCELIPDGSGLPGSPATALSPYWTYPGCVAMTGAVFVVALADGRHLKLVVDGYYDPAVQKQCDDTGTVPMTNTGSGTMRVRWAFLP